MESDGVNKGSCFTFSMLMEEVDMNSEILLEQDGNHQMLSML